VKTNHIFWAWVTIGILMVSPVVVRAYTIEPYGDPVPADSWLQGWSLSGSPTSIGSAEAFLFYLSGDPIDFKADRDYSFSHEGWTGSIVSPSYMQMRGTTPSYGLTYTGHYTGSYPMQSFYIDHLLYDEHDAFIGGSRHHWTGFGWSWISEYTCHPHDDWYCKKRCKVPEPTTILLLGAGLIGLGILGRKKFKKI
jgi:hypothetical protein